MRGKKVMRICDFHLKAETFLIDSLSPRIVAKSYYKGFTQFCSPHVLTKNEFQIITDQIALNKNKNTCCDLLKQLLEFVKRCGEQLKKDRE